MLGVRGIPVREGSRISAALAFAGAVPASAAAIPAFAAAVCGLAIVASALNAAPASAAPIRPAGGTALQVTRAATPPFANWPTFHGNQQLTGVSKDTAISTTNAGNLGVRWMTHTFGPVLSSPVTQFSTALNATLAYVANENGDLEAINVATGAIIWSDALGVPIHATPAVSGNHLWVGTAVSSRMVKVNANTGAVLCTRSLGTGVDFASPVIGTPHGVRTLFVGVQDQGAVPGPMMAINDATCKVEWKRLPYPVFSGSWSPDSYGVNATGVPLVIFGSGDPDCAVYALNARTGATLWRVASLTGGLADFGAGTVISPPGRNGMADGMAYIPGKDRILYGIDLTTGKLKWTYNYGAATGANHDGGRSTAALAGRTLVFGTPVGIAAVDAVTGKQIWLSEQTGPSDTEVLSSPLVTGPLGKQVVVYGDLKGAIEVRSLATGTPLYSYQTAGYVISSAADSAGNLIIGSSDGFLYDLAIGGSNGTAPTTSITSPVSGSVIANPGAKAVVAAGTATAGSAPVSAVKVAVQRNGAAGPWWNAAKHSWQPGPAWNSATLSGPTSQRNWALGVHVPREGGVLTFTARAVGSDGLVDTALKHATVTVKPVASGPHVRLSVVQAAPGTRIYVSGSGFRAREKVSLKLPGAHLGTVTAGPGGGFARRAVGVPARYDFGLTAITAAGVGSGRTVTAPLYVTGPWSQAGHDPGRTSDEPNDRVLSEEVTPGKPYRMRPYFVYTAAAPVDSSPAVASQLAFAGNTAGTLSAVHILTGALAWSASVGGAVDSSPAVDTAAGLVVAGSSNDKVSAFNEHTGKPAWTVKTGGRVRSSPLIFHNVVYVGADDHKLYAIAEKSGKILWTATVAGAIDGSPALDQAASVLVVGDASGGVTAFHIGGASPSRRWHASAGGAVEGSLVIAQGRVFVGAANGTVSSFTAATGQHNWSKSLGHTSITGAMAYQKSHLYIGASDDSLTALHTGNGSTMWAEPLAGPVTGVSVTDGMLFAESSNGTVTGLRIGGEVVWLAKTGAGLSGTPVIMDNSVFVGAEDGGLYCFTPFGEPVV
ncbi:MAG TPA: PQQ-binding-like beta-propeller repeat protein [Streptosporangiaceae bacterium]|nr:PQQ-binding-like beta-propeller repeat protein [Streptosporangiaceae bacterium]